MGRELAAARWNLGVRADEVAEAVGFRSERSVLDVERGRNLTRASRIRPWCQLLGIDVDSFLQRYAGVLGPEDVAVAVAGSAAGRLTYQDAGAGWADPLCSPALASAAELVEPAEAVSRWRGSRGFDGSAGHFAGWRRPLARGPRKTGASVIRGVSGPSDGEPKDGSANPRAGRCTGLDHNRFHAERTSQ